MVPSYRGRYAFAYSQFASTTYVLFGPVLLNNNGRHRQPAETEQIAHTKLLFTFPEVLADSCLCSFLLLLFLLERTVGES